MDKKSLPEDWLSAYYDGELSEEQKIEADAYLESSSHARRDLGEFTQISKLISDLPTEKAPSALAENITSFIKKENSASVIQPDSLQPQSNSSTSQKRPWLSYLYLSGTLASAALVMIAVFYSADDSSSVKLTTAGTNAVVEFSEKEKFGNKLAENEAKSPSRVAVSNFKEELDLKKLKTRSAGVAASKSVAVFKAKDNDYDVLSSRMYENINRTGKVKIAHFDDITANDTSSLTATLNKKSSTKSDSVTWEAVLSELETDGQKVATVILTCRDAKTANLSVQNLLNINSFHQLPTNIPDGNLADKADLKRNVSDNYLYYLKSDYTKNTKILEQTLRSQTLKQVDFNKKKSSLKEKDTPKNNKNMSNKFGIKMKKSNMNRSEAILQGNGAALYFEAEPVELLNTLHLIENQKAIEEMVVNGNTNLKRNELSNYGTNIELIYKQNKDYLKTPATHPSAAKLESTVLPEMIGESGNDQSETKNERFGKGGISKPAPSKSSIPKSIASKSKSSADDKGDLNDKHFWYSKQFGTNSFRGLNTTEYKSRYLRRNGFQTPVDLPILETKSLGDKVTSTTESFEKKPTELAKPEINKSRQRSKSKASGYRVLELQEKGEEMKRDLAEVKPQKPAKSPVKRYRVLFVFKEEKKTPIIEDIANDSRNSINKTDTKKPAIKVKSK